MKNAKIEFTSPDSLQKVTAIAELDEADTMKMRLIFDPEIGDESPNEFHTNLALSFLYFMQNRER
jgi:hypothetical protein